MLIRRKSACVWSYINLFYILWSFSLNSQLYLSWFCKQEPLVANDILNHPNFVKKNLCNSFSDRTVQRFYKFNTSIVVSNRQKKEHWRPFNRETDPDLNVQQINVCSSLLELSFYVIPPSCGGLWCLYFLFNFLTLTGDSCSLNSWKEVKNISNIQIILRMISLRSFFFFRF